MFLKRILTLCIAGVIGFSSTAFANTDFPDFIYEQNRKELRWAGANRIETAIRIASNHTGMTKNVILAPAADKNLVDTLTVAPLAYKLGAPILLNDSKDDINMENYWAMLDNEIEKVYIPTGEGVISNDAVRILEDLGFEVIRLGGKDRYETASIILDFYKNNFKPTIDNVCLVSANGIADALSVSPIAARMSMPIVLTKNKDEVAVEFEDAIIDANKIYAIGGQGVISDSLVNSINAERIGGNNRYETNSKIIDKFYGDRIENIYVANGANNHLVDSLTASIIAATNEAPIALFDRQLHLSIEQVINKKFYYNTKVRFLGGEKFVPVDVLDKIRDDKAEWVGEDARRRSKAAYSNVDLKDIQTNFTAAELMQYGYSQAGVKTGGTIEELLRQGENMDNEMQCIGDLIFFDNNYDGIAEDVAMYVSSSWYVHMGSDGTSEILRDVDNNIIAKRRFIPTKKF